jgi:hypothetical protein
VQTNGYGLYLGHLKLVFSEVRSIYACDFALRFFEV